MGALDNAAPHSSSAFFCRLRKQPSCRSPKCALPLAKLSLLSPSEIQGCIREANKSRVVLWHLAIRQHNKPLLTYLLKKVNHFYAYRSPLQVALLWILGKPQTKTLQLVVGGVQQCILLISSEELGAHLSTAVLRNQRCHMYTLQTLHCLRSHRPWVMAPATQEMSDTPLKRNFCVIFSLKII